MAAHVIRGLMARNPYLDPNGGLYLDVPIRPVKIIATWPAASLLAGLPQEVPASTINRLCASGGCRGSGKRRINAAITSLPLLAVLKAWAGPLVMSKADHAFVSQQMFDATTGWRFVNQKYKRCGVDSMLKPPKMWLLIMP